MDSPSFSLFILISIITTLWVSLISPVHSLNCKSQNFTTNHYANCSDLPTLNANLHYTYDASNSSLSVAFVATPPKSGGWIAWAINPTGNGMAGSQALLAFRSNGSVVAKLYNVSSYSEINETNKLSFDVWDLRAESAGKDGMITIFAAVKVPEKAEKLNQVWQVGAEVTDGHPGKHDFLPANLNSKGELQLVVKATQSPAAAPTGSSAPAEAKAGNQTGGVSNLMTESIYMGIFVFIGYFVAF